MKRSAISVIVCLWAYGIAASGQSEIVDRVAAVVNGEVITLSMVEDAMNAIWTDLQEGIGDQGSVARVSRSHEDALQKLIDRKLMLQEATKLGVIVSEQNLSRELAKVASRFGSPEKLSEALRQRGITQEDMEENLREQIKIREMVNRRFRQFLEVTDGDAANFFEQHKEKFVMPETVPSNRIFFQLTPNADKPTKKAVREKAEAVLKELKTGVSKEGMIDCVLAETPIGYFVIKLSDRRPARQATFDEVKEEIKASLLQQKTNDELEAWLKRQLELADIRVKVEFSHVQTRHAVSV